MISYSKYYKKLDKINTDYLEIFENELFLEITFKATLRNKEFSFSRITRKRSIY